MTTYHIFNIGLPPSDAWWNRNVSLGIITAGYENISGDKGDRILHDMEEGDWIIAYANGSGYVGAGLVGSSNTYKLVPKSDLPEDFESNHQHWRSVDWIHYVNSLQNAVSIKDAGLHPPPQAKQRLPDQQLASGIISKLAARSSPREYHSADEVSGDKVYLEGAVQTVLVDRYERDPKARAACIKHWGTSCVACGEDFGKKYGPIGIGFINVHHLKMISESKMRRIVNPKEDLRPVCPNCHAMLHKTSPPLTIEVLRELIKNGV